MRDTEPFTTSRVQVKVLALPVHPAVLTSLHWSPEVKCVQSGRQHRQIKRGHVNAVLFLTHGVRRHRITFQLADGEAGELSMVRRLEADYTSCLTRDATCDIFTILAHSNWHKVCACPAARHLACRQRPSWAGNAHVLAVTCERSKTVARSKLVANSALHDASLANSRARAIKARRTFRSERRCCQNTAKSRRDATGEPGKPYRRMCSRRSGVSEWSMLLHSTQPRNSLRQWRGILPAERDRRNSDWHLLVGRRQDFTLMSM